MRMLAIFKMLAVGTVALGVVDQFKEITHFQPHSELKDKVQIAANPPPPPPPRPPPQQPPRIEPADDILWDRTGAKGCTLKWGSKYRDRPHAQFKDTDSFSLTVQAQDRDAGVLYVPPRDTASGLYDSPDDLGEWLWNSFPEERVGDSFHDLYRTWGVGWALADLGIDAYTDHFGGKNYLLNLAHEAYGEDVPDVDDQSYMVDNKLYRATGASYSFTVNPEQGIIISLNRESPRYAANDREPLVPPEQLPLLTQFSDVAWITWKHFALDMKTDIKNLKYFLSSRITNKDTQQVLKRALQAKNWELADWPGHTFERNWAETKAILGTPNVQGFAYFLIQHKKDLGNMFIDKIQVFSGETAHDKPCILMHVSRQMAPNEGDVEAEEEDSRRQVLNEHVVRAKI